MIHFAALKSVGESCKLPLKYYQNNITGSIVLMNVMTEFGVTKIIFSSSATVYGDPQYLPLDENHQIGKYTYLFSKYVAHLVKLLSRNLSTHFYIL